MKKLVVTCACAALLAACNNGNEKNASEAPLATQSTIAPASNIVKSRAIGTDGTAVEMSFDNSKNEANIEFKGEKLVLQGQKPASGIWYKNDHYELRGKGEELELTKDGQSVFKSSRSIMYGERPLFIAAKTEPCDAGAMKKDCMKIKYSADNPEWEFFYDNIEGFTYEPGNEYELIVNVEKVDNPPADASNLKYTLVKEVSKIKK